LNAIGCLLVRRVDLLPHDYIYALARVLPVFAIGLPIQATCWAIGLAGRGSMIAMPRSMRGSVEQSQENQNGTQAGNAR
jgi:hypothetical protein